MARQDVHPEGTELLTTSAGVRQPDEFYARHGSNLSGPALALHAGHPPPHECSGHAFAPKSGDAGHGDQPCGPVSNSVAARLFHAPLVRDPHARPPAAPVQLTAVAAYCGTKPVSAEHLGHHEHRHADQAKADQDKARRNKRHLPVSTSTAAIATAPVPACPTLPAREGDGVTPRTPGRRHRCASRAKPARTPSGGCPSPDRRGGSLPI